MGDSLPASDHHRPRIIEFYNSSTATLNAARDELLVKREKIEYQPADNIPFM